MASSLRSGILTINNVSYRKEDLSSQQEVSFQSITINNGLNYREYEIYGYNPSWSYKVYLANKGSLDIISQYNSNYKYEIKNGCFILEEFDEENDNSPSFLIVGVS